MSLRLYAELEATSETPTPQPARVAPALAPRATTKSTIPSAAIIEILDEAAAPGESTAAMYQRKEHALLDVFAALSIPDARSLHRQLSIPDPKDPIAQKFSRLVADRQARLLAFLADARRRAARTNTRRR